MTIQYFGPASEPDYDRWMDDGQQPETSVCPGIEYWCGSQVDDPEALYCPVHAREATAIAPDDPTDGGYFGYLSDPEEHLRDE